MHETERRFQRAVDEAVLSASPPELRALQELDARCQLSGRTFYDAFSEARCAGRPGRGAAGRRRAGGR